MNRNQKKVNRLLIGIVKLNIYDTPIL